MTSGRRGGIELSAASEARLIKAEDDGQGKTMTGTRAAFFRRDGERYVPTGLGLSPWDNRSQSGVSLGCLIGHVFDTVPTLSPMLTARITLDILGTAPMEPLTPKMRILRDGPRTQLVEAELQSGGRTWVRATALRARLGEAPVFTQALTRPFPENAKPTRTAPWFEVIQMPGRDPSAGAMWANLTADAVEGEALTPLQRMVAIADFGAGTAPIVDYHHWTSANLDISVHMSRPPRGEWLLLEGTSESAGNGVGMVKARIGDLDGMFGTALQTIFLSRRKQE